MIDVLKAFAVANGITINESTDGPFITGGPSSPIGLDLPTSTFYLQTVSGGVLIWRKFGAGVNDWRQLSAQDIPFNNSGVKFNSTDTFEAIKEIRANTVFEILALTSSLNGNHNITANNSNIHIVSGTATGYSLTLPDATTLFLGRSFKIVNNSTELISIKTNSGATLASLISGDSGEFDLETNTTVDGTWISLVSTTAATGITSFVVTSNTNFQTSAATDTLITGFSVTPAQGRYAVFVSSDIVIGSNNRLAQIVVFLGGVAVANTRRTVQGVGSNYNAQIASIGEITTNGMQSVDVRANINVGTVDVNQRSLVLIRLGAS